MKLTQHEILSCTPNSLLCCFIFSIVHHSPYCWWCCYFSLSSFLVIFVWERARAMRTRQQKLCNCWYFHCSRSSSDDHKTMPLYHLDVLKNFSENIFTWAVVFIPYLVIYYYVTSSHTLLCSVLHCCYSTSDVFASTTMKMSFYEHKYRTVSYFTWAYFYVYFVELFMLQLNIIDFIFI